MLQASGHFLEPCLIIHALNLDRVCTSLVEILVLGWVSGETKLGGFTTSKQLVEDMKVTLSLALSAAP